MTNQWRNLRAATALLLLGLLSPSARAVELTNNFDVAEPRFAVSLVNYETEPTDNSCTGCDGSCNGTCDHCNQRCGCNGQGCNGCGNGCNACGNGNCNGNCGGNGNGCNSCMPWCSDPCPTIGVDSFTGFESFRGVSEGSGPSNFGIVTGLNVGLPVFEKFGIGTQVGFSQGVYDWTGRPTNGANESNRAQQQFMITYGFFRRACNDRLQLGVVNDWMINDNFGTLSQEPTMCQWRVHVGYVLNSANEIGIWQAWRDRGATQNFVGPLLPVSYRAISQTNLFWHHKWAPNSMDSWVWWGVPAYGRLNPAAAGSIGEFTLGGMVQVPIMARLSGYANLQYMKPSANAGVAGSSEEFYDLGVGISFVPGGSRSRDVTGKRWMPLMPVANNGNFLVDRSL